MRYFCFGTFYLANQKSFFLYLATTTTTTTTTIQTFIRHTVSTLELCCACTKTDYFKKPSDGAGRARLENAGQENDGPNSRAGKRKDCLTRTRRLFVQSGVFTRAIFVPSFLVLHFPRSASSARCHPKIAATVADAAMRCLGCGKLLCVNGAPNYNIKLE